MLLLMQHFISLHVDGSVGLRGKMSHSLVGFHCRHHSALPQGQVQVGWTMRTLSDPKEVFLTDIYTRANSFQF
jgi:hypothetical protein